MLCPVLLNLTQISDQTDDISKQLDFTDRVASVVGIRGMAVVIVGQVESKKLGRGNNNGNHSSSLTPRRSSTTLGFQIELQIS
uniref:Uncharacterized protein n=1 Tax=Solanum lycopersicum TaxID=4081 RepID=A0A3Q7FTY1_SOLLC